MQFSDYIFQIEQCGQEWPFGKWLGVRLSRLSEIKIFPVDIVPDAVITLGSVEFVAISVPVALFAKTFSVNTIVAAGKIVFIVLVPAVIPFLAILRLYVFFWFNWSWSWCWCWFWINWSWSRLWVNWNWLWCVSTFSCRPWVWIVEWLHCSTLDAFSMGHTDTSLGTPSCHRPILDDLVLSKPGKSH